MFARLRALFQRYANQHRKLSAGGFDLSSVQAVGHLDRVELTGTQVCFEGWTTADAVALASEEGQSETQPAFVRDDVARTLGVGPRVGFRLTEAFGNGNFTFSLISSNPSHRLDIKLSPFSDRDRRREERRLLRLFAWQAARLTPAFLWWALTHSPAARGRVKTALGLCAPDTQHTLQTRLFTQPDETVSSPKTDGITIIVPVYNAFDLLQECLERVDSHTDIPWTLILIEDCSPDERVRPWVRDWAAKVNGRAPGRVRLLLNQRNLGFIGAVNRGLAEAAKLGRHVVLLNSDAFVPRGWASRLIRPIEVHPDIASTTPMSNDAEICSVPLICRSRNLAAGQAEKIDESARRFHPEALLSVAPTGVGFCMAMHRDWLARVPQLDTVFGRGYGEEVDWCQRTRAMGGKHLIVPGLFVEHRGGESFGEADKRRLIQTNGAIVSERYPAFDADVQQFIANDPVATARLALAVAWAAADVPDGRLPLYVAHALGGGADIYLEKRISEGFWRGQPSLILRVGTDRRWQLEVVTDEGRILGGTDDLAFVQQVLSAVPALDLIYSCGVGDRDPLTLPSALLSLLRDKNDQLEILVHDFFMISPSYTLLDAQGRYQGPVKVGDPDPAHRHNGLDLSAWQDAWRPLLDRADHVTAFSGNGAMHVKAAYPDVAPRLRIQPHSLPHDVPVITPKPTRSRTIGVLGNIGFQKGLPVIQDLARAVPDIADLDLVVVGNVDPSWPLPDHITVHGTYHPDDLPRLVARYGITDWLIPSIWPETFSFTTHEALATGMPTFAFAIGAQGDAVRKHANGHIVPFGEADRHAEDVLRALFATVGQMGELAS